LISRCGKASVIISNADGRSMDIGPEADSRSLLQFFLMSGRLKAEMRRGWVKKLGMTRAESVADHSYRTALITLIFSDSRGLDTGKALRLALLHDLPEAIVGDAMPEERSGKRKTEMETKAMKELLSELPEQERALYLEAWEEFIDGKTAEARLVRQADKLEMAIQAWEYANERGDPSLAKEFWASAMAQVEDAALLEILRQVQP
jgi:putative hydrolases of HD superfamily